MKTSEHMHCLEVSEELETRLAALCESSGAWDTEDPYSTSNVELLVMATKLRQFIHRLPPVPDTMR